MIKSRFADGYRSHSANTLEKTTNWIIHLDIFIRAQCGRN